MQKSRFRFFPYLGFVIVLAGVLAVSGFGGRALTGAAAAVNLQATTTATVLATKPATVTAQTTATQSLQSPVVLIPVSGSTNLVLASQIIGFNVFINAGPSTSGTLEGQATPDVITQTPSEGTATSSTTQSSPTRTPTTVLATSVPLATGTPIVNGSTASTPSPGSLTPTATGLVGSAGLVEQPFGTVKDLLILNNVSFEASTTPITQPGIVSTPGAAQGMPTQSPGAATTTTPATSATRSVTPTLAASATSAVTPTLAGTATRSTTGTPSSINSTPSAPQVTGTVTVEEVPTTGVVPEGLMNSSQNRGQLVFLIVEVVKGTGFNTSSTRNMVAIPWENVQVLPSENKILVNQPLEDINTFPFFSQSDWTTIGTGANLQSWFIFWHMRIPSILESLGTLNPSTPIPELNSTPSTPVPGLNTTVTVTATP